MVKANQLAKLIEQPFKYGTNSETPSLWASMGYLYGKCARQLHYANKYGKVSFIESEIKAMETGKDIHNIVEKWFKAQWPDASIDNEVKRSFNIEINGQPFLIGAKADLIAYWHPNLRHDYQRTLIEIKYLYGRKAYYQILIEKLVFQDCAIQCFQYGNLDKPKFANQLLIPIKADINMAIVYAGRIITALYNEPPRFPNASYANPVCRSCMYREQCYSNLEQYQSDLAKTLDENTKWDRFKMQSQPYIDSVRSIVKSNTPNV